MMLEHSVAARNVVAEPSQYIGQTLPKARTGDRVADIIEQARGMHYLFQNTIGRVVRPRVCQELLARPFFRYRSMRHGLNAAGSTSACSVIPTASSAVPFNLNSFVLATDDNVAEDSGQFRLARA